MYNRRIAEQTPRARRSYITEQLVKADWQDLADRSCPLPDGVTPEDVLKFFGQMMVFQYEMRNGVDKVYPRNS